MGQINAYLTFNGNCREAMIFYKECLGGELTMQTVGETSAEGQCPAGMENQIMHASLQNEDRVIMASDMFRPEEFVEGNSVALCLNCSSEEEINTVFEKLSKGGKVTLPLGVQFWGAVFGELKDKFGKTWMLNYNKNQQE